jgi:hypothetical protein
MDTIDKARMIMSIEETNRCWKEKRKRRKENGRLGQAGTRSREVKS